MLLSNFLWLRIGACLWTLSDMYIRKVTQHMANLWQVEVLYQRLNGFHCKADKGGSAQWVISSPSPNVPAQKVRPDSYQRESGNLEAFLTGELYCYSIPVEGVNELWRWGKKRERLTPSDHGNVFTLTPPRYITQQLGSPHNTHTKANTHTPSLLIETSLFEEKQAFVWSASSANSDRGEVEDCSIVSSKLTQSAIWSALCDSLLHPMDVICVRNTELSI